MEQIGARRFSVILKPNNFPNRASLSRFLDRFEMLSTRFGSGALWMIKTKKQISEDAPLLRHSNWESIHGGPDSTL
jgi:hypothetical protein